MPTLSWCADRSVWDCADMSTATLPLDTPASVPWWPEERRETTFGQLLVRVVAETADRHRSG